MSTRLNEDQPKNDEAPAKPLTRAEKLAAARKAKKERLQKQDEVSPESAKAKWPPYTGKDSLLKDYRVSKAGTKREKVLGRGSARYQLIMTANGSYKLLAFYRNGKGVGSSLVKILKPTKKNARGIRDKSFLQTLQAAGVPVVPV